MRRSLSSLGPLVVLTLVLGSILWGGDPRSRAAAGPEAEARRLEVLFLGSENLFNHDPLARFRVIRKALGKEGINFTYSETLNVLTPDTLERYDVLLLFANHYTIDVETQGKALLDFARQGGGCVFLHCASACFRDSDFDAFVDLVGAQFESHGTGVFRPVTVAPDHPVMQNYEGFECWDETYVHKRHGDGRTILQRRDDEPWTWVKTYGEGRVFYTASGHDHRCWDLPEYHDLVHRAIRWTAGDDTVARLDALGLPALSYRPAAVPENPENPVGPNNELQLPLMPEDSMKLAQVPPGFALRLFAAEPMVVNPIAIQWDEHGRLWVVEAFDYPHKIDSEHPSDRIKIVEDTDGDGRGDAVTLFADNLNICTSVLPAHGGAFATDGRDIVFLEDSDADGHADGRRVLISGIKMDDTHAIVSNLRYGLDNWIYATVGYSGVDAEVGGERHDFAMAVFRFRPDGSALEVVQNTSNNTWGLGFTEEGDVVGSTANNNPSWYVSIPNRSYAAAHRPPAKVPAAAGAVPLFPITADYFQNWPKEHCSSGAGHALYTGRLFPEAWWNRRAFVCEPPMHLVTAPNFENEGTEFNATGFEENLYASADAWSAPVAAEVGPDGAVWIADWYCPVLNHNVYRPDHQQSGPGNAYVTPDRDREHGRIYRVLPEGAVPDHAPELETPKQCLVALGHPDQFWRLTAQRLLVQRSATSDAILESLVNLASEDRHPLSLHALRTLGGLVDRANPELQNLARRLANSRHRGTAVAALDVFARTPENRTTFFNVLVERERHPMVRKAAALALIEFSPHATLGADLLALIENDPTLTSHLATAVRLGCLRHPEGFIRVLLEKGEIPGHGLLERAFGEAVDVLTRDKSYLSAGLLAVARESPATVGRRMTEAAGAAPPPEIPEHLSESARRGRGVYLNCVACHQPTGEGVPGAFPPLAGSSRVLGDPSVPAKIILHGLQGPLESQGLPYNAPMPGHAAALDDREIADVLSYIRNAWGNRAGDVPKAAVTAIRAATGTRETPWTAEELATP